MYSLDFTAAKRRAGGIAVNHSSLLDCFQMLHLLPDELLVAIVEYCDQKSRKSLSLVSRRLRNPSQHIIFKTVSISSNAFETVVPRFVIEDGGHLPEVLQNDRLSSYIQTISIHQGNPLYHLGVNTMELLFTALHQIQPLRDIELFDISFSTTMLDQLCEVLSTRLYNLKLWTCRYPADYTIQQAALKIQRLKLALGHLATSPKTIKTVVAIIERSTSSISSLTLSPGLYILAYLGTMPRLTSLNVLSTSPKADEWVSNFLVANPQLVEFAFDGVFNELPFLSLPPSALPKLRMIRSTPEQIHHLLPGRPVAKVEIRTSPKVKVMVDGLRVLSCSAAPIVELTLRLHLYYFHLCDILDVIVESVPRLERIGLSFQAELSQTVLDHLVRLGSLHEVNLSVYVSSERWHDCNPKKSTIECNFREVLKSSIYFNWSELTDSHGSLTNANECE